MKLLVLLMGPGVVELVVEEEAELELGHGLEVGTPPATQPRLSVHALKIIDKTYDILHSIFFTKPVLLC